jgi:hypothetical protein
MLALGQKIVLAITAFTFALLVFSVIPWNSIIDVKVETDPITHEPIAHDFWWNLGWWFPELSALSSWPRSSSASSQRLERRRSPETSRAASATSSGRVSPSSLRGASL